MNQPRKNVLELTREIGQEIRRHRRKASLSQRQLADLAGIGKTAVFDLERGKMTVQLDTFLKALAVLNITLSLKSPLVREASNPTKMKSGRNK